MGLAATHLLAYGGYQFVPNNSMTNESLVNETHKKSDINWLTHQVLEFVLNL